MIFRGLAGSPLVANFEGWHGAAVRLLLLLLLIIPGLFAGCDTAPIVVHPWHKTYHLVRVTNPRGELVADWIAVGKVFRTAADTYHFRAVERDTAPPYAQEIHYPDAHPVEVNGANILVTPCGKPLWLYELEGY